MIEYWSVIGHGCLEGVFCNELMKVVVPGERDHSKLGKLHSLLVDPGGQRLRLSRWEVCDINRIFSKLQEKEAMKDLVTLAANWNNTKADNTMEVRALVGLCCIDAEVAGRYIGADQKKILAESKKAPIFDLSDNDAKALEVFFGKSKDVLHQTKERTWIPPTLGAAWDVILALAGAMLKVIVSGPQAVQCSAGHTLNPSPPGGKLVYQHLSPPFAASLATQVFSKQRLRDLDL